jgi:hypothetical protein
LLVGGPLRRAHRIKFRYISDDERAGWEITQRRDRPPSSNTPADPVRSITADEQST